MLYDSSNQLNEEGAFEIWPMSLKKDKVDKNHQDLWNYKKLVILIKLILIKMTSSQIILQCGVSLMIHSSEWLEALYVYTNNRFILYKWIYILYFIEDLWIFLECVLLIQIEWVKEKSLSRQLPVVHRIMDEYIETHSIPRFQS